MWAFHQMQWKRFTMIWPSSIPSINCAAVLYWRPGRTTIQSAGSLQLKFRWRQSPAVGCLLMGGAAPCLVYLCCQEQCWGCGWDPRFASVIQSRYGVCTILYVRCLRDFSSLEYCCHSQCKFGSVKSDSSSMLTHTTDLIKCMNLVHGERAISWFTVSFAISSPRLAQT